MSKDNGIVTLPSNHSVDETVDLLKAIVESNGATVFTVIDHSAEATKVGMEMPPTKLLIFGNPRSGTPVMRAAPSIALDLPLKVLVAEGPEGKVSISYNSPGYLRERHDVPAGVVKNLAGVEAIASGAGNRVGIVPKMGIP